MKLAIHTIVASLFAFIAAEGYSSNVTSSRANTNVNKMTSSLKLSDAGNPKESPKKTSTSGYHTRSSRKDNRLLEENSVDDLELDDLMPLFHSVFKHLSDLKEIVLSLKQQNHLIYKNLQKVQTWMCAEAQKRSTPSRVRNDNSWNKMRSYSRSLNHPPPVKQHSFQSKAIQRTDSYSDETFCPHGYQFARATGKCYRFETARVPWRTAHERCKASESELVSVKSQAEQRFINEQARKHHVTSRCDFWLGLSKRRKGANDTEWFWPSDGSTMRFSHWNEGEPNGGGGIDVCAQMIWIFNWRWNDVPCHQGSVACYVCQLKPSSVG